MLESICFVFIGSALASIVSITVIVGINYLINRKENDDA
jgi:hypothetical protein